MPWDAMKSLKAICAPYIGTELKIRKKISAGAASRYSCQLLRRLRRRRLQRDGRTGAGRTVASSGRVRVISSPVRADMLCSHEFVGTRLCGTMAVRRRSVAHVPHLPAASVRSEERRVGEERGHWVGAGRSVEKKELSRLGVIAEGLYATLTVWQ